MFTLYFDYIDIFYYSYNCKFECTTIIELHIYSSLKFQATILKRTFLPIMTDTSSLIANLISKSKPHKLTKQDSISSINSSPLKSPLSTKFVDSTSSVSNISGNTSNEEDKSDISFENSFEREFHQYREPFHKSISHSRNNLSLHKWNHIISSQSGGENISEHSENKYMYSSDHIASCAKSDSSLSSEAVVISQQVIKQANSCVTGIDAKMLKIDDLIEQLKQFTPAIRNEIFSNTLVNEYIKLKNNPYSLTFQKNQVQEKLDVIIDRLETNMKMIITREERRHTLMMERESRLKQQCDNETLRIQHMQDLETKRIQFEQQLELARLNHQLNKDKHDQRFWALLFAIFIIIIAYLAPDIIKSLMSSKADSFHR